MISIENLREKKMEFDYDVRVDRKSVLGNPFVMKFESERNDVCDKYKDYFNKKIIAKDEVFLNELRRIYLLHKKYGQIRLFCWCHPKRCHAETIKAFLEKYL